MPRHGTAIELSAVVLSLALLAATALSVPFVPQQKDTCGAAALAMVLRYYGQDVSHDAIASALVEPELHGIRGSSLSAFARERGMVAIAFAGDLGLLRQHLAKGRPLIVALSAGGDQYHDVVLTGLDEARHQATVNDPAVGPARRMSERDLQRRWEKTGRWTLLVQPASDAAPEANPSEEAVSAGPAEAGPTAKPKPIPTTAASGPGLALGAGYGDLVAMAVDRGRAGGTGDALALLDRAIALEPSRPEAWVERGGLRFLDGSYDEASSDLRRALERRDDAYTRELLGSSLQLAGRSLEALVVWNPLGRPTLGTVEIEGLQKTRDEVARREIGLAAGALVTPGALRAARQRLTETTAFERITLRPRPLGDGTADLEAALLERHGLAHGPVDFLVTTGVNLAWQRVRLRYSNFGGRGIAVSGLYRWQENRPAAELDVQAPRPFGLPVYLRLAGVRGEQAYDLGSTLAIRRRGIDVGLRHVLGGGAVLSLGLRARDRSISLPRPDAPPGRLVGLEAGLEVPLLETRRQRLEAAARLFAAGPALFSDLTFVQGDGELRYQVIVSRPEGLTVERSVLALRLRGGWGSVGQPVDEMYAPGISPDTDLPLRAHPQTRHGIVGTNPVGRSLLLVNGEWRQRLWHRPAFDVGVVGFTDAGRVYRPAEGSSARLLVDAGVGLRLSILSGPTVRVDAAWGLNDRSHALFLGLSQAF